MTSNHLRAQARTQRGYSLVEMLVVVALIGIFTLVAVPNFLSLYNSSRIKASARTLTASLRNARQLAISGNQRTKVSFATGTQRRSFVVSKEVRNPETGGTTWQEVRSGDLGEVMTFSNTGFADDVTGDGGLLDVVYQANGTIQNLPALTANRFIEIRTNMNVPKKVYRLTFTTSGGVTLS